MIILDAKAARASRCLVCGMVSMCKDGFLARFSDISSFGFHFRSPPTFALKYGFEPIRQSVLSGAAERQKKDGFIYSKINSSFLRCGCFSVSIGKYVGWHAVAFFSVVYPWGCSCIRAIQGLVKR